MTMIFILKNIQNVQLANSIGRSNASITKLNIPLIAPKTGISTNNIAGIHGICDFDIESVAPQFRKEEEDWAVAFNPKNPLHGDRLNVDLVQSLEHDSVVCCIRFSTCGKLLATGCNRYAQIFDVMTGQKIWYCCSFIDFSLQYTRGYFQ